MEAPRSDLDKDKIILGSLNTNSSANLSNRTASIGNLSTTTNTSIQQSIEKLTRTRSLVYEKMENLIKEMQDSENGVPVRSQKLFLTSIPSAFMGYDLIEWLMERLNIEESEALNLANQLCQHGYFFPVNDSKILIVKDDSSLYRFQIPYYFGQNKPPDNIDYAIYLTKRSLRNKQRHGLDDYELEALNNLHKNLKGKWDFITMQAEEQARLAKERKKGDKIVNDSQERAFWRVYRPPPGLFTPLEPTIRDRQGKILQRKRTEEDWQREVDILNVSIGRNRVKMSQACESLVHYFEVFSEYDPFIHVPLPSNPWITEDTIYWQINNPITEVPTEKRVKRWGISINDLVSDPTGLQEFTNYLKKEYSHENIRFWMAVNDLRRSSYSQITVKVRNIYEEFLAPGAPCEINIDGKTMELVQQELKNPSRFSFDSAADHVYTLLLKKDCYPRFIRSEHYKNLLINGQQPSQKKKFFGFGGANKKKVSSTTQPHIGLQISGTNVINSLSMKRRGSDSSSAHELTVCGVKDVTKVAHSHSQSNLSDIPYRDEQKLFQTEVSQITSAVCPWEIDVNNSDETQEKQSAIQLVDEQKTASKIKLMNESESSSSDVSNMSDKMRRFCGLRQNTLDSDFHSTKQLNPVISEQRRSSMTITSRPTEKIAFSQRPVSLSASTSANISYTQSPCDSQYVLIPTQLKKTVSFEETDEHVVSHQQSEIQNQIEDSPSEKSIENTSNPDVNPYSSTPKINVKFASTDTDDDENEIAHSMEDVFEQTVIPPTHASFNSDNMDMYVLSEPDLQYEENVEFAQLLSEGTILSGYVAPAPTPAPQCAPLAEIENIILDEPEDDEELGKSDLSSTKALFMANIADCDKRKKKKNRKDKEKRSETSEKETFEKSSNSICPWDDDTSTSAGASFVKTYSTLGYL